MRELKTGADRVETSLDPTDWPEFRALAHRMLDSALDHLEGAADRPVWRPTPQSARDALRAPPPMEPEGAARAAEDLLAHVLPYPTGNTHPRFFGWVHGTGTPGGIVADIMAAAMNANLGGRDHAPILVEKQVIEWMRRIFGFPENASGLILSGTSMATLIAVIAARKAKAPHDVRRAGVRQGANPMVGYTSSEAHSCIAKAFDQCGLGLDALRRVPVRADLTMDVGALRAMIAEDRAAGALPFAVIGAAATVNTGATDDLDALADIAAEENLWFHVDGAFGAVAALSDELRPRLRGIERADSIAFDFHKWMHVQYDAGCVLIRDGEAHLSAFAHGAEYLTGLPRGLGGGKPWFSDYGIELSRGFRALKVWFALKEHGLRRIGEKVEDNVAQAAYLARLVDAHQDLERLGPAPLNIVCFRYAPDGLAGDLDAIQREIVMDLQESGAAAPSTTTIRGRAAIRINITNHRTKMADMDVLVAAVLEMGARYRA
ncbi:cytochrome D ubiquinol oxidase subunit I [Pikeienuella piscinae]|uniref:Cytochrome D ubiquinol oxidase subunit I n=1 Tax=Pikeienuella piscinae TaxID=2748098 RepID=A0A7L5BVE2_9RHOB|nr:pyridoxal-dependent decarboxylase [Pikeienuella piscinae]QIE54457.1 cytochrome D ubiquinol oxidase subunit I [Pikeienuella piscinae]